MRTLRTLLTAGVAAALGTLTMLPMTAAAAPRPVLTAGVGFSHEYVNTCQSTAPYTCTVADGLLQITIQVRDRPTPAAPITVGYQIVDVTTTAGADYTGPTSGTVTIPATANYTFLYVPVVRDSVAETSERFDVRLTSSSISADRSDIGWAYIYDGGRIPPDCVETAASETQRALTCSARPAGQQWRISLDCQRWTGPDTIYGTLVTGNGRSEADCGTGWDAYTAWFTLA
ncbi:MAG TPA: Calx-beta domain-containing protein [Pseudonocardiaceae bacterium]